MASDKGPLNSPNSIVVDSGGMVLVADRNNQRILLLDKYLNMVRVILGPDTASLNFPYRIAVDPADDARLLVGKRNSVGVYKMHANELQDRYHWNKFTLL